MPSNDPRNAEDRKFLHDLATPLTVVKQLVKRTLAELLEPSAAGTLEKQIDRMQRTMKAIEQMETLHADQKAKISTREAE